MRKFLWYISDAGMKLVYLIFCDDMALNDNKKKTKQQQQQQQQQQNNNNKKTTKNKQKKTTKKQKKQIKNKTKQKELTISCLRTVKY